MGGTPRRSSEAVVVAFFPYYSLYLRENAGLTGTEWVIVLAVVPLIGSTAQVIWGQVADRTGARTRVLAVVTLGAAVGYAALGTAGGFRGLVVATAGLSVFASVVVPVSVSVSLTILRDAGPHAFGFARAWGTVGFLLLVVGSPWALDRAQAALQLVAEPGGPSEPGLESAPTPRLGAADPIGRGASFHRAWEGRRVSSARRAPP